MASCLRMTFAQAYLAHRPELKREQMAGAHCAFQAMPDLSENSCSNFTAVETALKQFGSSRGHDQLTAPTQLPVGRCKGMRRRHFWFAAFLIQLSGCRSLKACFGFLASDFCGSHAGRSFEEAAQILQTDLFEKQVHTEVAALSCRKYAEAGNCAPFARLCMPARKTS